MKYYEFNVEKNLAKIEQQMNEMESKKDALLMQKKIGKFVEVTITTKGRQIIKNYAKSVLMKDAEGKKYEYIEADADYIRSRWSEIALELSMSLDELESGRAFIEEDKVE